jgi:hypothetical protein
MIASVAAMIQFAVRTNVPLVGDFGKPGRRAPASAIVHLDKAKRASANGDDPEAFEDMAPYMSGLVGPVASRR